MKSTGGYDIRQFGLPSDVPVAGNYDGDGTTDIAVFRPASGEWFVRDDSGAATRIPWGGPGDVPISAGFASRFGGER